MLADALQHCIWVCILGVHELRLDLAIVVKTGKLWTEALGIQKAHWDPLDFLGYTRQVCLYDLAHALLKDAVRGLACSSG